VRKNIKAKKLNELIGAERGAPSTVLGTSLPKLAGLQRTGMRGVGVPLSFWKKESPNRRKGKEIEDVFHCKTTGLQRGLNGAMKGREREESDAQVLSSWSGAFGARFFRVACNLICVGVASIASLHGRRYGGEYVGATGRKWSLGAGGRDFQTGKKIKNCTLQENTKSAAPG
jgi:hypothetical protein